jgi:hypothetical protein
MLLFHMRKAQQVLDGFITCFSVNQQKLLDAVLQYEAALLQDQN